MGTRRSQQTPCRHGDLCRSRVRCPVDMPAGGRLRLRPDFQRCAAQVRAGAECDVWVRAVQRRPLLPGPGAELAAGPVRLAGPAPSLRCVLKAARLLVPGAPAGSSVVWWCQNRASAHACQHLIKAVWRLMAGRTCAGELHAAGRHEQRLCCCKRGGPISRAWMLPRRLRLMQTVRAALRHKAKAS